MKQARYAWMAQARCNMSRLQTGTAEQDARMRVSGALFSLPGRYLISQEKDANV